MRRLFCIFNFMKIMRILFPVLLVIMFFSACSKKESYDGIARYVNPPKDSVAFAYRLNTITYLDKNSSDEELTFDFTLDSGFSYAWSSVKVKYPNQQFSKTYTTEYVNGRLVKLSTPAVAGTTEDLTIEYIYHKESNKYLISKLKYYFEENPFVISFIYDSVNLVSIKRRVLYLASGSEGYLTDSVAFCKGINIGSCALNVPYFEYSYQQITNSLFRSQELIPILLVLKQPYQANLLAISSDLPLLFSRTYPLSLNFPNAYGGSYDFGLNNDAEPSFFYFKSLFESYPKGYNFSMRIN